MACGRLIKELRRIAKTLSLDWNSLDRDVSRDEISKFVKNPTWQEHRKEMKGKSLEEKHRMLTSWLQSHNNSRASQVQVANYVKALRRGGLI